MIEREKIEEIKSQTNIVDVVSQYIPLKKVGKNYRAVCPFHAEKDPSFYVSAEKGIYYCFGCRKGGNAISFLMEYEHLDFPDAVKKLAKTLGIEIDTTRGLKYRELYDVNETASQFYAYVLSRENGRRGINYLNERSLNVEKVNEFRLGYAPSSGGLVTHMRQKGIGLERLNQAGLVNAGRELFHDRLMFPFFNVAGRVIGFGGRSIDASVQPKYLNSPETPIFRKGENLYGLFQAKETMRQKNEAVLVEGYFDLLSLFQHGIKNIGAPLGTALTEKQAVLISRYARKIHLLFDGDLSGIKAALRAIGLLINAQVDVSVATLPGEADPDEYIKEHGAEGLNRLIAAAPDFFHFYKNTTRVKTVEDEVILIKELLQIINSIQDPIRFDRYLKHAEQVFNLSPGTIQKAGMKKEPARKPDLPAVRATPDEHLLALILNNREYLGRVRDLLTAEDFAADNVRKAFDYIVSKEYAGIETIAGAVDAELGNRIMALVIEKDEHLSEDDFVSAIKGHKNKAEQVRLTALIADAKKKHDDATVTRLQTELLLLKQRTVKIPPAAGVDAGKGAG